MAEVAETFAREDRTAERRVFPASRPDVAKNLDGAGLQGRPGSPTATRTTSGTATRREDRRGRAGDDAGGATRTL